MVALQSHRAAAKIPSFCFSWSSTYLPPWQQASGIRALVLPILSCLLYQWRMTTESALSPLVQSLSSSAIGTECFLPINTCWLCLRSGVAPSHQFLFEVTQLRIQEPLLIFLLYLLQGPVDYFLSNLFQTSSLFVWFCSRYWIKTLLCHLKLLL